jgi:hypothetical protein
LKNSIPTRRQRSGNQLETARYLQDSYTWVNREQDIGLEGLRQAKSSYVPDRMVKFISGKLKG